MEFQAIYDLRDRIKPLLKTYGIKFTELKPSYPFLYDMLDRPIFSKQKGFHHGYGWCGGRCRWGTTWKQKALDQHIGKTVNHHYIGIAADELPRLKRLQPPKYAPLAEWGMTEADCLEYCHSLGYFWNENGVELYSILDRVSCWCCANKNLKELNNIYHYLPNYWERLKSLQSKIERPFKGFYKDEPRGIFELEERFRREDQTKDV